MRPDLGAERKDRAGGSASLFAGTSRNFSGMADEKGAAAPAADKMSEVTKPQSGRAHAATLNLNFHDIPG
jgi:hypothetical protein